MKRRKAEKDMLWDGSRLTYRSWLRKQRQQMRQASNWAQRIGRYSDAQRHRAWARFYALGYWGSPPHVRPVPKVSGWKRAEPSPYRRLIGAHK